MLQEEKKAVFNQKELELLQKVCYWGIQWIRSVIDADIKGRKGDLKLAHKAERLIKRKLNTQK